MCNRAIFGGILPAAAVGAAHAKDMMSTGGSMNDDSLDRILSRPTDLQPSSNFTASVMEAVREEASAPPPIPFPWKRALPMMVFAALALVGVVVAVVVALAHSRPEAAALQTSPSGWTTLWLMLPFEAHSSEVLWTTTALLSTLVSVKLSMRLAAGKA